MRITTETVYEDRGTRQFCARVYLDGKRVADIYDKALADVLPWFLPDAMALVKKDAA